MKTNILTVLCILMIFGVASGSEFANMLSKPLVLNNFVTELLRVENISRNGDYRIIFSNPREGWILVQTSAWVGRNGKMTITLKGEQVIVCEPGNNKAVEVMRYLPAGNYSIRVNLREVELNNLTVRTIPVLIYDTINYPPYMERFGRYSWDFLKRIGMLDSCNVMLCGNKPSYAMKKWMAEGKHIVTHIGVPGLGVGKNEPVTKEGTYKYWSTHPGLTDPQFEGGMVDEFFAADPIVKNLSIYRSSILRILKEGKYNRFYAYLGDGNPPYRVGNARKLRDFVEPLAKAGGYFAFERYLQEKPTEEQARKFMTAALKGEMQEFQKYAPDFATHCIYTMGFLCAGSLNLNNNPGVNFKVHLDMQFHLLATDPVFTGLLGIEEYLSGYCDEEYLRWCAKLFRHYCIEGNTDRLTRDPYELNHIRNGDFEKGLKGWTVIAAEPGSVQADSREGYGNLQGRYPKDNQGDTFIHTKRCKSKPNVISQQIRNLEPGRFYSVKMISGDFNDQTVNEPHRVYIEVTGAERLETEDLHGSYPTRHLGSQKDRKGKSTLWFNYHRIVFKAIGSTAQLKIYDWYTPTYRKGKVGQEMMLNDIEVEPYLIPDIFRE